MDEAIKEIWVIYGTEIVKSVLMAIIAVTAASIKKLYDKYVNTETKQKMAKETVRYVEQIFKALKDSDKYAKAYDTMAQRLSSLGINYDELELKVMIESAVNEYFPHEANEANAEVSD